MTEDGGLELTARENAVLAAIGRRLSNSEIAAEFHISVRTVESHIASLRRKLDADSRLKLIMAARARRGSTVQVPQNSFVGRGQDLAAVGTLLDRERWVTVVGAAGCGKTRLALELAAADGRVPVIAELEHATPGEVVNVIAKAVGLGTATTADLVAATGTALGSQRYLLVVDNCDRVGDAVRQAISTLLVLAGTLTVLATSRAPIGGSDEAIYALSPLPLGDRRQSGAVRLFLDRARSAGLSADLDDELVSQVCRRLDGLPLAIELAAARTRHLPLPELAERLENGFESLARSGPATRHHTLATAFEWTWDLLDSGERQVLSRLASLPRTFDLELAEAVCRPGAGRVVLQLLDRSLLAPATRISDPRRFRLLDALRAFVLDRTDPAVVREVRHAHARYYADRAGGFRQRARTDDSRAAAELASRLCSELNAAADWAIAYQQELVLPLAHTLAVGGEQYGPDIDSLGSIARAARLPYVRDHATPTQLLDLGIALCYSDLDLVDDLAALAARKAAAAPPSAAESAVEVDELAAHHLAGYADAYRNRGRSALAHLAIAERLADKYLDIWQLASIRQAKGIALRSPELNDPDGALAAFESAMRSYALAGDAMHVNNARYMMAATAADSGRRIDEAVSWVAQCAEYARGSGNRHELAHAMLTRASLSGGADPDPDLLEAVRAFRSFGDLRCLTRSYLLLARGRTAIDRVPLLEQALDAARSAHDSTNEAGTLEQLISAHWESGGHRQAYLMLGALSTLIGQQPAVARCPRPMVAEVRKWSTAITEGQARSNNQPVGVALPE